MIPNTMSASSLKTWLGCQARWKAENYDGGRGLSNAAADLGTTCHLALEDYVKHAIMNQTKPPTEKTLLDFYINAYIAVMKSFDFETKLFKEGENMMRTWHERTDFDDVTVLSCEVKDSFELPYTYGGQKHAMRFNYIADRVDQLGPTEYRVVDYKSWRGLLGSDEVKGNLQARVYALAYQIVFKHATRIWVQIDQLRGDPVGYCFTREDNVVTFKMLKAYLQDIVDTDPARVRETLNEECGFCVRKSACRALKKHADADGIMGLSLDELIKAKYEASKIVSANEWLIKEIERRLAAEMDELDLKDLETLSFDEEGEKYKLSVYGNSRSEVDSLRLPAVIGEDVALSIAKYTVSDVKDLRGDPRIDLDDWSKVEELITKKPGKRTFKVTPVDNKKWEKK